MTMESARTVVNKLLKYHEIGKVSFFGGEPLTNFAIIQYLTKSIANQVKVDEFEITTDLILLTSEMVSFFERYNFSIIVSLDGPERIHYYLRPACNYDIILLDEPTASIDPVEESNIYKKFAEISKGKTSIIITHRLGAAKIADRIIVLRKGKIVEEGKHEDLMELNGYYASMYKTQQKWYIDK